MGRVYQLLSRLTVILFFVAPQTWADSVNNIFTSATGAAGNTLSVMVTGNDNSGKRNGNPFRTPQAAKNAALGGDTVIVYPGTYTNNNLLKSNVNWFFYPGATIYWQVATNIGLASNNAWGIFDDRTLNGNSSTNVIGGQGTFIFDGWSGNYGASTNGSLFSTNTLYYVSALGAASNTEGCIVQTNYKCKITMTGHEVRTSFLTAGSVVSGTFDGVTPSSIAIGNTMFGINIQNCTNSSFTFDNIGNSTTFPTNQFVQIDTDGIGDFATNTVASTNIGGMYWAHGETYFQVNDVEPMASYGLWTDSGDNGQVVTNNGPIEHCWATFQSMKSFYYDSGLNTNYRTWILVKDLEPVVGNGGVVCFGSGKVYVDALKITGAQQAGSYPLNFSLPGGASPAGTVWIRTQKITSTGQPNWLNNIGQNCYVDCQLWEDQNKTVTTGIVLGGSITAGPTSNFTNTTCFIRGQSAVMTAGGTFLQLGNFTNRVTIEGLTVDTSLSLSTNPPILLLSNMVNSSNLFLQNLTFTMPAFQTNALVFSSNANNKVGMAAINWNTTNISYNGNAANLINTYTGATHQP